MANLNYVCLLGNLTRDPELSYTPNGTPLTILNLATNYEFIDKNNQKKSEVCFIQVEVWNKPAKACADCLKKGSQVLVTGRIRFHRWEDQNKAIHTRHDINATKVIFLARPTGGKDIEADNSAIVENNNGSIPLSENQE